MDYDNGQYYLYDIGWKLKESRLHQIISETIDRFLKKVIDLPSMEKVITESVSVSVLLFSAIFLVIHFSGDQVPAEVSQVRPVQQRYTIPALYGLSWALMGL